LRTLSSDRAVQDRPISLGLRTYKAAIYDTLTRMISELELLPGTRLVEADLAERFQMSKTPIREALLLLDADGLVKLEPYQGATVTWLSLDEYEELLFIQDALEQPSLARVVERIQPRERSELEQLVARIERNRRDHDSRAFFETGALLHERMFGVAGEPRLVRVVMSLISRPGRRYQRVFIHQFDDAWDVELQIMKDRFQHVSERDPSGAAACVASGRAAMLDLIRGRLDDPRIAPYLTPAGPIRPRRTTRTRIP
jgi:DNA-binding GntR family transcriptional regulator